MLAVEWPEAVQQCRLSAADFADAQAAEAALLRLAAAAEQPEQLRLLLRVLAEVLPDDAFPAAADAAAAEEEAAAGEEGPATASPPAGTAAAAPVPALHRAWAACLRSLLPLGELASVLAALDEWQAQHAQQAQQLEQQSQQQEQPEEQQEQPEQPQGAGQAPALLTQQEAEALLEAADVTQGPAAAAAAALLLPYPQLRRARWQHLLLAVGGGTSAADLAAALPGLAPLLLLLVRQQPGLLAELASGGRHGQAQLQQLVGAALMQQQRGSAYCSPLGVSSGLTLRLAVAAVGAAELAAARQYVAAAWLAMQAAGTPCLLRVLNSGTRMLQRLLRSCASGSSAAAEAAVAAARLEAEAAGGGAAQLEVPLSAAALLRALPEQCSAALGQLAADLQLQP